MEMLLEYNPAQLDAFKNVIITLIRNTTTTLPTAVSDLMEKTKELVIKNTHFISHRLQGGWVIQKEGNSFKLVNTIWYASGEFRRPGTNPRFGTGHNPLPSAVDLISNNIEPTVTKAMLTGISR